MEIRIPDTEHFKNLIKRHDEAAKKAAAFYKKEKNSISEVIAALLISGEQPYTVAQLTLQVPFEKDGEKTNLLTLLLKYTEKDTSSVQAAVVTAMIALITTAVHGARRKIISGTR